jgi:glycosyltransferase involved in cell wall biosynthesis
VKDLAMAMHRIAVDPNQFAAIRRRGLQLLRERYSSEAVAQAYEGVYRAAVDAG